MKTILRSVVCAGWILIPTLGGQSAESPVFAEVYSLIRSNLAGLSDGDLDRMAVQGLLRELHPRVLLVTNATGATGGSAAPTLVAGQRVFGPGIAHVRVGEVEAGLSGQLDAVLGSLGASNRIEGVALDLRFAGGWDYAEAARVADRFLSEEKPLLAWGDERAQSTAKTNGLQLPVVLLVNGATSGAAEALAGALRQREVGLLLGARTAGQARIFREVVLTDGRRLRIATGAVRLGDGVEIPAQGLEPDIAVPVKTEEERMYVENPYWAGAPGSAGGAARRGGAGSAAGLTNRAGRITEADLVRMKREGVEIGNAGARPGVRTPLSESPPIADPALSRAVDLLKGLAVFRAPR